MAAAARPFDGQQVWVVGGSSGIGAGIAAGFAQQGASVTVTGATPDEVSAAQADPALAGLQVRHSMCAATKRCVCCSAPSHNWMCWSTAPA